MSSQLQVTGEAKIRDIQGPVVANSGVITALDGAASQYVRGDGTLADFPTSTGGGSSVSYYLNGSVNQGTFGGSTYYEMSKTPIIGAGTDFPVSTNGLVSQFITDANDPDLLEVPGGNFNVEFYFSVSNNTGNPTVYAELYKYDGATFTLLGSSQAIPESINQGTTIAPYYFAIPVGTAALNNTDRIAIRIYANVDGRTVTLHTENSHLCQVVTTFSKGMVSLNNLTDQNQYLATGTSGTDFNIVSSGDTHTFNIPSASNNNRGLITNLAQTIGGIKTFSSNINADSGIRLKNGVAPSANGYVGIGSNTQGLTLGVYDSGSAYYHELYFPYTNGYEYTFPSTSGTLALTSNLSSYVPYTGATTNVDLGANNLTANYLTSGSIVFWKGTGSGLGNIGIGRIVPLGQNTTGQVNIGIGENSLFFNTTGSNNIALGGSANGNNTTGSSNIGIGSSANYANTTASNNIAIGLGALANNTVDNNVAIGHVASYFNTTGNFNVAVGHATLYTNTTGSSNTAIGSSALYSTTTGVQNTAIGKTSMFYNTTGGSNTAIGTASLQSNTTGSSNTGIGTAALGSNTTGIGNIAIGNASGFAIITGSNNTIIGNYAGTSAMSNNIVLADGAGNIRYQWNGTNNVFGNHISGTSATFSSSVTASSLVKSGGTSSQYLMADGSTSTLSNPVTGTGTTNYLPKFTGASTIGNSAITDDGTTVTLISRALSGTSATFSGIVSATSGDIRSTGTANDGVTAGPFISVRDTSNAYQMLMQLNASYGLDIWSFGGTWNKRLTLTASGNLGLGVTPSAWSNSGNLDLQDVYLSLSSQGTYGGTINNNAYYNAGWKYKAANYATQYQTLAGEHRWLTAGVGGAAGNAISFTQAMTLTASGNLGIGNTNPLVNLVVTNTSGELFRLTNTTGIERLHFYTRNAVSTTRIASQNAALQLFAEDAGYDLMLGTSNAERMRITSGGNVGIGTSSPGEKLTINGGLGFQYSGTQNWHIASNSSNNLSFTRSGIADRMVITSDGNVGIGTSSPSYLLSLATTLTGTASGDNTALFLESQASGRDVNIRFGDTINASGRIGYLSGSLYMFTNGSERMRITSLGGIVVPYVYSYFTTGAAANVVVASNGQLERSVSSLKYKKNVEDYTKGIAEVMQMRPVTYNSINEREDGILYAGLIAEEVHDLGLTEFVQYAEDGTPDALAYQNMVALLVKAIQEQQAQIEELKALINK